MTANFHPGGDIGYVKKALGHYVENVPVTQILCTWRSSRRIGFRQWGMVAETLNTDPALVSQIPNNNPAIVPT
jgi:oxalate decarboxylase